MNLIIDDKKTNIQAARLNGAYLGLQVFVQKPDSDNAGVVGVLESFTLVAQSKKEQDNINISGIDVYVVVSGTSFRLKGDHKIVLTSGGLPNAL